MNSKGEKQFLESFNYALSAPFISWPGWDSVWTSANKEKARLYRLAKIAQIMEFKQATDFEALLYLSSMSMVAPLHYDGYRIFRLPIQAGIRGQDVRLYGAGENRAVRQREVRHSQTQAMDIHAAD